MLNLKSNYNLIRSRMVLTSWSCILFGISSASESKSPSQSRGWRCCSMKTWKNNNLKLQRRLKVTIPRTHPYDWTTFMQAAARCRAFYPLFKTFYPWIWGILSIYFIKEINFLFVSYGKCLTGTTPRNSTCFYPKSRVLKEINKGEIRADKSIICSTFGNTPLSADTVAVVFS